MLKALEKATELAVPLQPKTTPPPREPIATNEAEVRSYAGIYQNAPGYLRLELIVKDSKLFLKQAGQSEMSQEVKVGENIFNAAVQEFLLIPGPTGKPKYLHVAAHALRRM